MNPAEMGQGIYTSYLSGVPPQPRLARKGHGPSRTDARLAVIADSQRSLGSGQFLFNQIRISHETFNGQQEDMAKTLRLSYETLQAAGRFRTGTVWRVCRRMRFRPIRLFYRLP